MKLLFTKGRSPLSKLIRWGLNEPVSHFAVLFDEKLVFHSNLLGCQIKWFSSFAKHLEIPFSVVLPLPLEAEEAFYSELITQFDETPYDFKAFFYFIYRGILYKVFNEPMPSHSPFNDKQAFLCTEMARAMSNVAIKLQDKYPELKMLILPEDMDLSIISPYKLLQHYQGNHG